MPDPTYIAALAGLVGTFIVGGSLFAFSTFIMQALKRIPVPEGIRAMQQINKTVFTPWFMGPFFIMALLAPAGVAFALMNTDRLWAIRLGAASAIYGVFVFLVTALGNVPLNNKLAAVDADDPNAAEFWRHYLTVWTRWNHVRVIASLVVVVLLADVLTLV